jgi:hypothetical protein
MEVFGMEEAQDSRAFYIKKILGLELEKAPYLDQAEIQHVINLLIYGINTLLALA